MISLPVIENGPQRPDFAQGPRSLQSVRLLRLSVTDRCNLRCVYCMPEEGIEWMAKQKDMLRPEDFEAVGRAAVHVGVDHIKVTGGEPTIRHDVVEIIARLKALGVRDLSMTTNGVRFDRLADRLKQAGLDRVTFSLDSLRRERYAEITSGGNLDDFWRGIEAAERAGFRKSKINVVVMAGVNDDEVADFAELTYARDWTIRFIEYMPLGDSALIHGDPDAATVDNDLLKARIHERFGSLKPLDRGSEAGVGPAHVYKLSGARGRLGFISAMSKPFCESCNRLRLTAIGELRSCLFDGGEVDLLPALRPRANLDQLIERFATCVELKPETHSKRGNRAMSQLGG